MSALADEIRDAVAVAVAPLCERIEKLAAELSAKRITLQAYRGGSARAAAAFERRHPDLTALAKAVIGRRRYYLPADLDGYFGEAARSR